MSTPSGSSPAPDTRIHRRVLYNTLSNYIGQFIVLGAGFLLTPFVLHTLGPSTYGEWVLVGSVVAYGSLLDFGIGNAVTKYIAEYNARGEVQRAQSLVATALWVYIALGLVAALGFTLLAPLFPRLFNVPPEQHATVIWLVTLSGINLGISIPGAVTSAILRGLQRFELVNLIRVIGTLLSTFATVAVLLAGAGVLGVAAVSLATNILIQIPSIWLVRRLVPHLRVGWRSASRQLLRTVASFSASLFVVDVAGQLQAKTDEIVIAAALPIFQVTPYNIARRLSEVVQQLTDQFVKVLLPLASELQAKQDSARLRALYLTSTRLTLLIFLPLGCVMVILARPILTAWVGAEYAGFSHLILILTLAGLIDTSQWPASFVLQGMARHRPLAIMSICSGLANLALSILLVQKIGITGVALGTLVPTTLECLLFVAPYAMRVVGVRAGAVLKEVLWPALLPVAPAAVVLIVLQEALKQSLVLSIAIPAISGILVYYLTYLAVGATASERQTYRHLAFTTLHTAKVYLQSVLKPKVQT